MKLALALFLLAATTASHEAAQAAAPVPCDNEALIRSLAKLPGSKQLKVVSSPVEARIEIVHGPSRDVAMRVTCDAVAMPLADHLDRPSRGAATRVVDGITLARTANGAISLDFPAQMLDPQAVQMLLLDDDSVSVVRGARTYYAFATRSDGTVVETEGVGNGCGCERIIAPDGTVTSRRLPR